MDVAGELAEYTEAHHQAAGDERQDNEKIVVADGDHAPVCSRRRHDVNVAAPIRLRDADVERDRAEAEAAIAYVAQTRAAHRLGHAGRAREALDRFGQVGVRRAVAGDERAHERHDAVEVEAEHAIPAGYPRPWDVEPDDEAAGHGDAPHLGEAARELG